MTFGLTTPGEVMIDTRHAVRHTLSKALPVIGVASLLSACGGGSPLRIFHTISGSVAHLDSGALTITDGYEPLTISQGAIQFSFPLPLPNGANYNVKVISQPANEHCVVSNGSGVISGQNVSGVSIACNTALSNPTTVSVYPVDGGANSSYARVYIPVGMVGSQATSINAILDTGSAGVDLNALDIFPSSVVTANGFIFPAGQSTINYNGIIITSVKVQRFYGSQGTNPTQDIGNIGFAQITMGSGTQVTTAILPILFAYQHEEGGVTGPATSFANLIGINPNLNAAAVPGSPYVADDSLSPCTPQSTSTCGLASPFRFLTYSGQANEGYILSQVTLNDCSIGTTGSCAIEQALTLGLNQSVSAPFNTTPLMGCRSLTLMTGSSDQFCDQEISGVQISSGGSSFSGLAIFDSGEPTYRFEVPSGTSFPSTIPPGTVATVTVPSGFSYQFTAGAGYSGVIVDQNAGPTNFSNLGIAYFTQHSLLVNYQMAKEGFK